MVKLGRTRRCVKCSPQVDNNNRQKPPKNPRRARKHGLRQLLRYRNAVQCLTEVQAGQIGEHVTV